MSSLLLKNCGPIISGDLSSPLLDADSVWIVDGRIAEIGTDLEADGYAEVIDVKECVVAPGLIDSHAHPVVGGFSPRQNVLGWTDRTLHGGVTSLVSAGEVHWPGRAKCGAEAVAICAAAFYSSRSVAEGSSRVHGGALILDQGVSGQDIRDLNNIGVKKLGEIGLGSEKSFDTIVRLVRCATQLGWVAPVHFGGASVPGSSVVDADYALSVGATVISHINGGPTSRPLAEVDRLLRESDVAIEVVFAGNALVMQTVIGSLTEMGQVSRLQFGTDTPSGTGVVPLAMLRVISEACAGSSLRPELALCAATGSTADRYGLLDLGYVREGHLADLVILDVALGAENDSVFDSMRFGNVPAVAAVVMNGRLMVTKSAATPPPVTGVMVV